MRKLYYLLASYFIMFSSIGKAMEGTGSLEDPFLITNVEDFNEYCSLKVDTFNAKLVADIVLNKNVLDKNYQLNKDSFVTWDKSVKINATFDGNGHSISGLFKQDTKTVTGKYGLFAKIGEKGLVKNLTVKDAYLACESKIKRSTYFGGICTESEGIIDNCHFEGCIVDSSMASDYDYSYAGGICGSATGGSITNCSVNGSFFCKNTVGGIVGNANDGTKVSVCTTKGSIYCDGIAGGIVGKGDNMNAEIDSCYNYANITASYEAAGILAKNRKLNSFNSCFNFGNIESTLYHSAGISAGYAKKVTNCENVGTVIGSVHKYTSEYSACGIVFSCDTILNCNNQGTIKGTSNVAGICGSVSEKMVFCHNSGSIIATGDNVAGICVYYGVDDYYPAPVSPLDALSYNTGDVTGKKNVAGITTNVNDGISACFNLGHITADTLAAGIVPDIHIEDINNCYNLGTITAKYGAYGISRNAIINSCFNGGIVEADTCYEPLAESKSNIHRSVFNKDLYNKYSEDSYADYGLSTEELLDIKIVLSKLGNSKWCMNEDHNAELYYPQIKGFNGILEASSFKKIEFDENGFCKEYPNHYQPAPIVDSVVQISNGGQLFWYQEKVNHDRWDNVDAVLLNDIVIETDNNILNIGMLSDTSYTPGEGYHEWRPIGYTSDQFKATIDGKGHTISGLVSFTEGEYTNTEYNAGLVSTLAEGGVIKDLTIADSHISTLRSYTAGLVANNRGEIKNCKVKNCLLKGSLKGHTGVSRYTGGICCKNYGVIDSVDVFSTTVYGLSQNGGIASVNYGTVSNCTFYGNVISDNSAAGIVSNNNGIIRGCTNKGSETGSYVGGICYSNSTKALIENCINASADFHNIKNPHLSSVNAGGICTNNETYFEETGKIINCTNIASSDSISFAGICDYNLGLISNCWNKGKIMNAPAASGIVNTNGGTVELCFNLGEINGIEKLGGIVAWNINKGNVKKCMNFGNVSGTKNYIGGIVGLSYASVDNCANWGTVSGADYVGGVVGGAYILDSCYSVGSVYGNGDFIGCIVGKDENKYASNNFRNCYANSDSCSALSNHSESVEKGTTYLISSSMRGEAAKNNMVNLDFENIWYIVDGQFPLLTECKDYEDLIIKTYTEIRNCTSSDIELKCFSANGIVFIMAPSKMNIPLFNVNGMLVKNVFLHEGMNEINDIEKGIYILGDKKIIVR